MEERKADKKKKEKWAFEDYAFVFTGFLVGFLLVVPEILYSEFGITILGGSMGNGDDLAYVFSLGASGWTITELRAISPMLFLLTVTVCFIHDAVEARKTGGYQGSVFTYTYESLVEDAIYMVITTIMVYHGVLSGAMYASWLAAPVTWVLFMVIFPLIKRRNDPETAIPWTMIAFFVFGLVVELITRLWIAFPLTWLVICAVKFVAALRIPGKHTVDTIFEVLYYAFSVIVLAVGLITGSWIMSWTAFLVAMIICWVLSRFKRFRKEKVTPPFP